MAVDVSGLSGEDWLKRTAGARGVEFMRRSGYGL
jgi:hypothetical protein